ncbi:monovalent cation/H(+) antiporter subunit G [Fibrobacterales bacterium]|nr:monovalent cation/H(+) antiporter subunit G [Fibrobacterales bacterium]
MQQIFISVFLIIGTFFLIIAGIGILKMPDLFTRMHATTKAGTVGLSFILLALCVGIPDLSIISRAAGTLLFIFITAPVGAHLLGKVMLEKNYPFFKKRTSQK